MRLFNAAHLALAASLVLGPGVYAKSSKAKPPQLAATKKKTSSTSTTGHSKRSKSSKSSRRNSRVGRQKGQKAPTSDRITEIQNALSKNGVYPSTPNGKWDANTVDAVKKFQEAHGLNPSGKLDAKTLQQLGLGSQTAGVAPPMPPVSSSSNANPPKSLTSEAEPRQ